MVNSATGEAASPSMRTICQAGAGIFRPLAPYSAPRAMAQGSGLVMAPRNERNTELAGLALAAYAPPR